MQDGLYVGLSSHLALERRLNTVADNIANANTVGFRATNVKFEEILDRIGGKHVSFVTKGDTYLSANAGPLVETGNALDFAIQGDAWFAIDTSAGTVMTRDGRFKMLDNGDLVSMNGYAVLDAGGAQIALNPQAGEPVVGRDGLIRQGGQITGGIGLFSFVPPPNARRFDNSGIIPNAPPEAVVDRSEVGVMQGYLEQSNVNAVQEMTHLIAIQRTFENVANLISRAEDGLSETVKAMTG